MEKKKSLVKKEVDNDLDLEFDNNNNQTINNKYDAKLIEQKNYVIASSAKIPSLVNDLDEKEIYEF